MQGCTKDTSYRKKWKEEEDELSTKVWLERFSVDGLTWTQRDRNASKHRVVVLVEAFSIPCSSNALSHVMES